MTVVTSTMDKHIFILIFLANTINSKEIHISQHGKDGQDCGNNTSPCLTMKQALKTARWNDVILIRAFRNSVVSSDFCMSDTFGHVINKNLTVMGIQGRPVVDCRNRVGTALFYITGNDEKLVKFVIKNLQIQNILVNAVTLADGIFVAQNCIFSKIQNAVVFQNDFQFPPMMALEVHHSIFNDCKSAIKLSSTKLWVNITNSEFLGDKRLKNNVGFAVTSPKSIFQYAAQQLHITVERCKFLWNRFSISLKKLADNTSVSIHESIFEENSARGSDDEQDKGAALYVLYSAFYNDKIIFTIKDTSIKSNEADVGGAIFVDIFKSYDNNGVRMLFKNVTFLNNTAHGVGGAIFLSCSIRHVNIYFKKCIFVSNRVDGANKEGRLSSLFYPAFTGTGGGIYIAKGDVFIDECNFSDNTATMFGGGIASTTAKVSIKNSVINGSTESNRNTQVSGRLLYLAGDVTIENVTTNSLVFSDDVSDVWYQTNSKDNDISVKQFTFYCPVGAEVRSVKIKSFNYNDKYHVFEYRCKQCKSGNYSLQAGKELLISSTKIKTTYITCLPCPYGATCYDQIRANPNFWGFEEKGKLKLKMCPPGYCSQGYNYHQVNACSRGRRGKLCGRCVDNYSENLFHTNCSQDSECNDQWIHIAILILAIGYVWVFLYLNDILKIISDFILPSHDLIRYSGLQAPLIRRRANNSDEKSAARRNCIPSLTKIVLYFYQLQSLINIKGVSVLDNMSNRIKHITIDVLSIQPANNIVKGCPFKGMIPVTKRLYKSLFNIYIYLTLIVIFLWVSLIKPMISGTSINERFIARLCQGSVTLILLNFAHMGNMSLTLLHCVHVLDQLVLFIDGEITCFQPWQYGVMAYVIVFIVPVTFVLLFGVKRMKSKTISVKDFMLSLVFPLAAISFFLNPRENERNDDTESEEATDRCNTMNQSASTNTRQTSSSPICRQLADSIKDHEPRETCHDSHCQSDDETTSLETETTDNSGIQCNSTDQSNHSSNTHASNPRDAILDVLARPFLKDDGTGPVYWEGILLLRRLFIIILSVMIENKEIFLYLSLMIIIITLVHHHWKQPFGNWIANVIETVSLILLGILCTINLFYAHYMMDDLQLNAMALSISRVFDWITFAIAIAVPFLIIFIILEHPSLSYPEYF